MNGLVKEEHDSDIEVLNPQVLKKEWLNKQICLATQLMNCRKPIPKPFVEFEKFVHDNIDWLPSFGLIHAIWEKMCKVEGGNVSPEKQELQESERTTAAEGYILKKVCSELPSDSSISSHNSSRKNKKKSKAQEFLDERSSDFDETPLKDDYSPCSSKSLKVERESQMNDIQNSRLDESRLPPSNRKKKHKDKMFGEQSDQSMLYSSPEKSLNMNSESNDDVSSFKKRKKKKKRTDEIQGTSSSNESENHLLNDNTSENGNCSSQDKPKKNKKKKLSNGLGETSDNSKRKRKKSEVMSEEEAHALREELLADRIMELELPKVIKEMKGAITKMDKCISNLEIKGQLTKIGKTLSKIENKSIIKKLEKKKSV